LTRVSQNYLTLKRVPLKGKRRRDMPHCIIWKRIILGLKKSQIVRKFKTFILCFVVILCFDLEICSVLI